MSNLTEAIENIKKHLGMTDEELKRFSEASNHPYECKCQICIEWWELVGPEE